jgi:NAD(P)-dependent dehydrogenase (short-subunit alcohol dehydrogenase family)
VDTRTAIVTGASSGIGLALAQALGKCHRYSDSVNDYSHAGRRGGGAATNRYE